MQHPIRSLLAFTGAIMGFAALAPPASHAAAPVFTPFTVVKHCGPSTGFTGLIPSMCKIIHSVGFPALKAVKVIYYGPQINSTFVSSTVVLDDGRNGTAIGHCIVHRTAVPLAGMCTFNYGTGSLAGFQAVARVTFEPGGIGVNRFRWEGLQTHGGP